MTLEKAEKILRKVWGYESFRPGQDVAISSILKGMDTLVLFPTGGGKSLCYQVPALVLEGMTVVISPLISLMQDQVEQLNRQDIAATSINSTMSTYEVEQKLVNARNGMYKLLYCSPERLQTTLWQSELPYLNINLVAIDEAHCISQWGHDFRPSYRDIKPAFQSVSDKVRWMALTATATPEVRNDIIENMDFHDPVIVSKGYQRPNLKWWVTETNRKKEVLLRILQRSEGSGLIYAKTRKKTEELAEFLNKNGTKAVAYHAGLSDDERQAIQQKWLDGRIPVVTATNAFGMGIDKPDCRFVVHFDIPLSLEAYYQEAGRAGRDGKPAYPVLLYNKSDGARARELIKTWYPDKSQLQIIYNSVCDFLKLAVGSEQQNAQMVPLDHLGKRSGLSPSLLSGGLSMLNQLGILDIIEHYQPKLGIHFLYSRYQMAEYVQSHENRKKARFIDQLMRLFEPSVYHQLLYAELNYVCKKLNVGKNALHKAMEVLSNEGLINYEVTGDKPLILLHEPRQRTLPLSRSEIEQQRRRMLEKLEYMIQYSESDNCRSRFIRHYFGESDVPERCGYCDNCLKKVSYTPEIDGEILQKIRMLLRKKGYNRKELKKKLGLNTKELDAILQYLKTENMVHSTRENGDSYYWKE